MLHLYATAKVEPKVMVIDSINYLNFERAWFNTPEAIYCIETLDGNKNIGDGVSDSPWLGIIPPQRLSGGCKAIIYAMANPNTIVPLDYCGDNCAPIIEHVSKTKDMSMVYGGCNFIFTETIPIHCMEHDIVVKGDWEYIQYIRKYKVDHSHYLVNQDGDII